MSSVDDLIDQVNRPATTRPSGARVAVSNLTPGEKQDLKEQGYDIDGQDFVDLALAPPAPEVDPLAEDRRRAAEQLASVGRQPEPVKQQEVIQQLTVMQESARVKELQEQLKAAQDRLQEVPSVCNRCGWPTGERIEVQPTTEDVQDFLRAVMGGEVFAKEYHLFNRELVVVFRTRTGAEETAIKRVLRTMSRDGLILSQHELISQARRLSFICSLKTYITKQTRIDFDTLVGDSRLSANDLVERAEQQIERLPSQVLTMLMRKYDEFSEVVDHLLAKVDDPGFWSGMSN